MNPIRILIALGVLAALSGCGEDAATAPETMRKDRVTAEIRSMSTHHDCDPAEDNPGDFVLYTEIYEYVPSEGPVLRARSPKYEQQLNTRNGSAAAANFPNGEVRATWDAPRVDGAIVRVIIHVEERDPGLDVEYVEIQEFGFSAEKECWIMSDGNCNPTLFHGGKTFREDEFKLFNPDDEGCEIAAEWLVNFQAAN